MWVDEKGPGLIQTELEQALVSYSSQIRYCSPASGARGVVLWGAMHRFQEMWLHTASAWVGLVW